MPASPLLPPADDLALPFAVEALDVRGRVVRLGPALDALLARHAYPEPVARLVAEAVTLTALLGTALKLEGRLQLQTRSSGVVEMLVVDFETPGALSGEGEGEAEPDTAAGSRLRATARFDAERLKAYGAGVSGAKLLGRGHLAFTIEPPGGQRYQGIVALEGQGLEEAARQYFRSSEQIPTSVRLAVARAFGSEHGHGPETTFGATGRWRAGGLLAQFLPVSPERQRVADLDPGDAPEGTPRDERPEDEAWTEAQALVATVEDHELIDPTLAPERLLYRLFHERGVKVFGAAALHEGCRCSRGRILVMLRNFPPSDRADMLGEDGRIGVTCEFCGRSYAVEPAEVADGVPPAADGSGAEAAR